MKDKLRSVAEATGLLDVLILRRRVTSIEDGLAEHRELQRLLAERVDELEETLRSIVGRRPS